MKERVEELAVFGGGPAFSEKLHVGRPNVGDRGRLLERINRMLDTRWLSNDGPLVVELERRIAELVGVKHCIAMCNATIAMEIVVRALGMTGEVIVPSFTFIATAHALQWQQITPVFCDIEPDNHLIDPASIERMVTPRTTGIIGVHLWGRGCDVEAIMEVARRHKLKVLFDAAHAFDCTHRGEMIGRFGDAEVFSFHATKFFNSFEGGAVLTNDDDLARQVKLMKNFGFSNYDEVTYIGTNGKMTEVSAAMGLTSLESMDEFVAVNRANYEQYWEHLSGLAGLRLLAYDDSERYNYQYIVAEVDDSITGVTRDELVHVLWGENVFARRYFYPGCHRMEPYRSFYPHAGLMLPVTERVTRRVMALPNGTAVGPEEIAGICGLIRLVLTNGGEVHRRLSAKGPEFTRDATLDGRTDR